MIIQDKGDYTTLSYPPNFNYEKGYTVEKYEIVIPPDVKPTPKDADSGRYAVFGAMVEDYKNEPIDTIFMYNLFRAPYQERVSNLPKGEIAVRDIYYQVLMESRTYFIDVTDVIKVDGQETSTNLNFAQKVSFSELQRGNYKTVEYPAGVPIVFGTRANDNLNTMRLGTVLIKLGIYNFAPYSQGLINTFGLP